MNAPAATPAVRQRRVGALSYPVRAAWTIAMSLDIVEFFEFAHAVEAAVNPPPSPRERRLRDLGPLAAMLDRRAAAGVTRGIGSTTYDQRRPAEAPSSEELIGRYGGKWARVLRCARALNPDGSRRPGGKPWASPSEPTRQYTRAEVVIELAQAVERHPRLPPSLSTWNRFWLHERFIVRERPNASSRLPAPAIIRQYFPTLADALAAVPLPPATRISMRARLLPPGWVRAVERRAAERNAELLPNGVRSLPASEAVMLAIQLDGSLAWLAGEDPARGQPPQPGTTFDARTVRDLRKVRRVGARALMQTLGYSPGAYRRLVRGTLEPDLGALLAIAELLAVAPESLLRPAAG